MSGQESHSGSAPVAVTELKVDYIDRPLGLENASPHFSWRLQSLVRNVRQTAFRILVASSPDLLAEGRGDLWDSGKVVSRKCQSIAYRGRALTSRQRCYWRVQIWNERDEPSAPSPTSGWEMGLLSTDDWSSQWIAVDDAASKGDREAQLQWMWSGPDAEGEHVLRHFRCSFSLPFETEGGALIAFGKSFERVLQVWLDGSPLAGRYSDHDATREWLSLGPLAAGEHEIRVKVQRKCPWPETYCELPTAGLTALARFDHADGKSLRVIAGDAWAASPDGRSWSPVELSPGPDNAVPEPAMNLRRAFGIEKEIAAARLYVAALGCCVARLNGLRVGDALLTPEVSQYEKRTLYRVYDVGHLLNRGENVLAFTVGDGWYASHPSRYVWGPPPRRLMAQLELTFCDGTRSTVSTDTDWRIARSPIVQSELCVGEIYDARLERPQWDVAGFDDSNWPRAAIAPAAQGRLAAQVSAPIRATKILAPVAISTVAAGVHVIDFGQNFAGWCRIHVKGDRGTRIDLRYGEQTTPQGTVDQFSLNGGKAVDTYFLRGDPQGERLEPHFTYHGFRYVQVTGLAAAPSADLIAGVALHSDLNLTGDLRVQHPLVRKLWENIVWTQRSNLVSVGTDCCNRAERMGYFLDMSMYWEAASFNMDVAAFTRRQLDNARDHQYETGALPSLAPAPPEYTIYRTADGTATPGWGDGVLAMAWTNWRYYGDVGVLEQNWEAMNRHLQFILDRNPDYLWLNGRKPDLGDWLAVEEVHFFKPDTAPTTPLDLFATAHWARSAQLLAQMAQALERHDDAQRLLSVREKVRRAFIDAYVDADGRVGNGSQTSFLLALKFDLVPADLRRKAVEWLVHDILERGSALSTGLFGTQYLLDVLADAGHTALACTLLLRREWPSWGYMIDNGATTIWERWDGSLTKTFVTASHSHPALGSVGAFLFRRLAGIEAAEPGFQKIRVRPLLDSRIRTGGGDYDSIMGQISTRWDCSQAGRFVLDVTIPPNCTAEVHLPAQPGSVLHESGEDLAQRRDMRTLKQSGDEVIVEIGSGKYHFVVESAPSLTATTQAQDEDARAL